MHLPQLIVDLAYILGMATFVTLFFRWLKLPVILGYILAGLVVSPNFPGPSVMDVKNIQVWAELGVIFLMFSLGLEFSFRRLASIGFPAAISGVVQVIFMLGLGYFAGRSLGWKHSASLFLGSMISISSTMIIAKIFEDLNLRKEKFAAMVYGILIVEDIAAILILAALSAFGTQSSLEISAVLLAAGQLFLVIGAWFLFGMFIVPRFMRSVGRHKSNELLVLSSTALCLALVCLASKFEYSVALGAFMMGSILAETGDSRRIEVLIEPLRDLFGAVFFVSIGMLLDPNIIWEEWYSIVVICIVVLVGKILAGFMGSFIAGQKIIDATRISFSKAQIGEFSFIIASLGLSSKVVEPKIFPMMVAVCLITTFVSSYLIKTADFFGGQLQIFLPQKVSLIYDKYCQWLSTKMMTHHASKDANRALLRWLSCSIVVIVIFESVAKVFINHFQGVLVGYGNYLAWSFAFIISMPFLWGLIFPARSLKSVEQQKTYRRISVIGSLLTVLLIGFLSREFLSFLQALGFASACLLIILLVFKRQLEARYRWFEAQFLAGFSPPE